MKKLLASVLLLSLLLAVAAGCAAASPTDGADSLTVYRIYTGSGSDDLVQAEACILQAGEYATPETALRLFASAPRRSDLRSALNGGVELTDYTVTNGLITLELSDAFLGLSPIDRSLTAFCAALTLCSLEDVDAVSIRVGDELLFSGLDAEGALLTDTDSDPYTRRLRLYFADESGRWLVSEYHSLSLDENASLERYVIEELLRGPNDPTLSSAIPAGTDLLSCSTENGVCTVDLSAAFMENRPQTALGERLTVCSLVNSLTVLSEVDSVRILCEGQPIGTYVCRSLAEPLAACKAAIGPASAAKGETELLLAVPTADLSGLALFPCAVDSSSFNSLSEAAVAALYDLREPGLPALFTGAVPTLSVANGLCTVALAESFFASLTTEARTAAVHALAATVLQTGEVRTVRITVDGADAVFEEISYAGPYAARDFEYVR